MCLPLRTVRCRRAPPVAAEGTAAPAPPAARPCRGRDDGRRPIRHLAPPTPSLASLSVSSSAIPSGFEVYMDCSHHVFTEMLFRDLCHILLVITESSADTIMVSPKDCIHYVLFSESLLLHSPRV